MWSIKWVWDCMWVPCAVPFLWNLVPLLQNWSHSCGIWSHSCGLHRSPVTPTGMGGALKSTGTKCIFLMLKPFPGVHQHKPPLFPRLLSNQPNQQITNERRTPPTASAETTVVTKWIKVEGSGSRGCVCTADFDELTCSIIEETISIYHAQIGTVEPFPERTDDHDTVKQAWVEVCTSRNLRVELEEDIFKLVSQFWGFFMFHIGYSNL